MKQSTILLTILGLFSLVLVVPDASGQQSCRGACGQRSHRCELDCPAVGTREGDACMEACTAELRECVAQCE